MGVVVPLFKEASNETVVTTQLVPEFQAVTSKNIYTDIQLQIELIKRKIIEQYANDPTPTTVNDLGRGWDGLYTALDLLANAVSGTLFPAHASKHIKVVRVEDAERSYGVALTLMPLDVAETGKAQPVLELSVLQVEGMVLDTDAYGGVVDEAWEDRAADPDYIIPDYMGNIVDNMACMAMCNTGYATLSSGGRFTVNLPFHPSRVFQMVATIR